MAPLDECRVELGAERRVQLLKGALNCRSVERCRLVSGLKWGFRADVGARAGGGGGGGGGGEGERQTDRSDKIRLYCLVSRTLNDTRRDAIPQWAMPSYLTQTDDVILFRSL